MEPDRLATNRLAEAVASDCTSRAAAPILPSMPDAFPYDVFLSHSEKDKAVVRPLAERLRGDGLNVWFR